MVVGAVPAAMHDLRFEFWRVINLYHVCTYVLADKVRPSAKTGS